MIQRKQSVFLLLAAIATIICLCMPVATIQPKALGVDSQMYNLWIACGNGALDFSAAPLFGILLVETVMAIATIFMYNKRKLQIRLCNWCNFLIIVWYAAYVTIVMSVKGDAGWHICFAAVLPLVAMILVFMARKGVIADERLIRAAERIR